MLHKLKPLIVLFAICVVSQTRLFAQSTTVIGSTYENPVEIVSPPFQQQVALPSLYGDNEGDNIPFFENAFFGHEVIWKYTPRIEEDTELNFSFFFGENEGSDSGIYYTPGYADNYFVDLSIIDGNLYTDTASCLYSHEFLYANFKENYGVKLEINRTYYFAWNVRYGVYHTLNFEIERLLRDTVTYETGAVVENPFIVNNLPYSVDKQSICNLGTDYFSSYMHSYQSDRYHRTRNDAIYKYTPTNNEKIKLTYFGYDNSKDSMLARPYESSQEVEIYDGPVRKRGSYLIGRTKTYGNDTANFHSYLEAGKDYYFKVSEDVTYDYFEDCEDSISFIIETIPDTTLGVGCLNPLPIDSIPFFDFNKKSIYDGGVYNYENCADETFKNNEGRGSTLKPTEIFQSYLYRFVADSTECVEISLNSPVYTTLRISEECPINRTSCPLIVDFDTTHYISITIEKGKSYFILVGSEQTNEFDFNFSISTLGLKGTNCAKADNISSLPYKKDNINTICYGIDYVQSNSCNTPYINGSDYVLSYLPIKDESIVIEMVNHSAVAGGLIITENCPGSTNFICYKTEEFDDDLDTLKTAARLEKGKLYFIIISSKDTFSNLQFDIKINNIDDERDHGKLSCDPSYFIAYNKEKNRSGFCRAPSPDYGQLVSYFDYNNFWEVEAIYTNANVYFEGAYRTYNGKSPGFFYPTESAYIKHHTIYLDSNQIIQSCIYQDTIYAGGVYPYPLTTGYSNKAPSNDTLHSASTVTSIQSCDSVVYVNHPNYTPNPVQFSRMSYSNSFYVPRVNYYIFEYSDGLIDTVEELSTRTLYGTDSITFDAWVMDGDCRIYLDSGVNYGIIDNGRFVYENNCAESIDDFPYEIQFFTFNSDDDIHLWDFDGGVPADGSSNTSPNPVVSFATSGVYTISHQVVSSGCMVTYTENVQINVFSSADFISIPPSLSELPVDVPIIGELLDSLLNSSLICQQDSVFFISITQDTSVSHFWDFGDVASANNNFSTETNPRHKFIGHGLFQVKHTVFSVGDSCSRTETKDYLIKRKPSANITTSRIGCEITTIKLFSDDRDDNVQHYWNQTPPLFENGKDLSRSSFCGSNSFRHTTILRGCTTQIDTVIQDVSKPCSEFEAVNPNPFCQLELPILFIPCDFTLDIDANELNLDSLLALSTDSIVDFNENTYWDFGDPSSGPLNTSYSGPVPNHHYKEPGRYTVTYSNVNECCISTTSLIVDLRVTDATYSYDTYCHSGSYQFLSNDQNGIHTWTFAPAVPTSGAAIPPASTDINPEIEFTTSGDYIVTHSVFVDSALCIDLIIDTITIRKSPSASFTTTIIDLLACIDTATVVFTPATQSIHPNNVHFWDFDFNNPNQNTSTLPSNIVGYNEGGNYLINHLVTDTISNCSVNSKDSISLDLALSAAFNFTKNKCVGESIEFTAVETLPQFFTEPNFVTTFTESGTYTIIHSVLEPLNGCFAADTIQLTIDPPVNNSLEIIQEELCTGQLFYFDALSAPDSVAWKFSDNQQYKEKHFSRSFSNAGNYTVILETYSLNKV
ncbi:MAG: PKD repeat protein, partial [Sphingobacteriales bacterium]